MEAEDLKELGYDQIAAHFSDKAIELEAEFPRLMEPMLYAAKAILALGRLNSKRKFAISHLEKWRMNSSWMLYAKGALQEKVAELDSDVRELKADLQEEAYRTIVRMNMRVSDEKVQAQLMKNQDFRVKSRQLSELRAILAHVLDHCEQYRLIKDVLVQESTLTKLMVQ